MAKTVTNSLNADFQSNHLLKLTPVKRRQTLADQIVDVLLARITSGDLKPGDRLPTEQKLSEAFQVSRAVVREAMARLKQEGLIETKQGLGAFLVEQTIDFKISTMISTRNLFPSHIMELRRAIEPAAAYLAAERRTEKDIFALKQQTEALKKAGDSLYERTTHDMFFHQAIVVASANPLFISVIEMLKQPITDFLSTAHGNTSKVTGAFSAAEKEHAAIIEAIIAKKCEDAASAMMHHLERSSIRLSIF